MYKKVILTLFAVLCLGLLFLLSDIKNAYKSLPIQTSETMKAPPFADWREYNPQSKRFKVMFPEPPQYAKQTVPVPNTDKLRTYEMYVSENLNTSIFMISLISYPTGIDISDKKQLLHDVVDEMMQTKPDNRLKKIEDTTYENYPAVDFNISNNKFNVDGRAFLVDRTVYLLSYIAKISDLSQSEYEYFINSFHLTSDEKTDKDKK